MAWAGRFSIGSFCLGGLLLFAGRLILLEGSGLLCLILDSHDLVP